MVTCPSAIANGSERTRSRLPRWRLTSVGETAAAKTRTPAKCHAGGTSMSSLKTLRHQQRAACERETFRSRRRWSPPMASHGSCKVSAGVILLTCRPAYQRGQGLAPRKYIKALNMLGMVNSIGTQESKRRQGFRVADGEGMCGFSGGREQPVIVMA